jgi:hypothetical protein
MYSSASFTLPERRAGFGRSAGNARDGDQLAKSVHLVFKGMVDHVVQHGKASVQ